MDPKHRWTVCIGVPYGTHIWQFGDASEMNGSFKIFFYRAKQELILFKQSRRQPATFTATDVIPLVNKSWDKYKLA